METQNPLWQIAFRIKPDGNTDKAGEILDQLVSRGNTTDLTKLGNGTDFEIIKLATPDEPLETPFSSPLTWTTLDKHTIGKYQTMIDGTLGSDSPFIANPLVLTFSASVEQARTISDIVSFAHTQITFDGPASIPETTSGDKPVVRPALIQIDGDGNDSLWHILFAQNASASNEDYVYARNLLVLSTNTFLKDQSGESIPFPPIPVSVE